MKAKQQSIVAGFMVAFTVLAVVSAGVMGTVQAADVNWDGAAVGNDDWSDPANWGGTAPVNGDDVQFTTGNGTTINVDITPTVGSIRFLGHDYALENNSIAINPSGRWGTLYDIYIGGQRTRIDSGLRLEGDVAFLTANFTTVSDRPVINGIISEDGTSRSITFEADSRYKTLSLRGANTYSGGTTVSNMTLEIGDNSALGTGVWTLADGAAPTYVYVTKDIALNNPVSFQGDMLFGRYSPLDGTLTLNGPISIDATGVTIEEFDYLLGERLELAGTITDNGNGFTVRTPQNSEILLANGNDITGTVTWQVGGSGPLWNPDGAGAAVLALGDNQALGTATLRIEQFQFSGGLIVSEGASITIANDIVLDAGTSTSIAIGGWGTRSVTLAGEFSSVSGVRELQINPGSTLAGIGTITADTRVNFAGADATLAPAGAGGMGALTINGDLRFVNNTTLFQVDLRDATPGGGHDQVVVTGDVVLNNAQLGLTLDAMPRFEDADLAFILVNDGLNPISGIFNGLANGATINLGTVLGLPASAQISYFGDYVGGSATGGNDVVLYNFTNAFIPEPSTLAIALLGLGFLARRRRR